MNNIGCWNTWGLNSPQKQKAVTEWINKHHLDIVALFETKIAGKNLPSIQTKICHNWHFQTNHPHSSPSPCRIMLGWNPNKYSLVCTHINAQWITCSATHTTGNNAINITFVYGLHSPAERKKLWEYINASSGSFSNQPWVIMGDFNAILSPAYKEGGDRNWYSHSDDFANSIHGAGLIHLPLTGPILSWHNGQQGGHTIQKKLDWAFVNHHLLQKWPSAITHFQPRSTSDHSAMHVQLTTPNPPKKKPFHFLNLWLQREDFPSILASVWDVNIVGNPMHVLHSKLRALKARLKHYHKHNTNHISRRLDKAKEDWTTFQQQLNDNPTSQEIMNQERAAAKLFAQLSREEEYFYKQQSRVQWLQLGDQNTKFFHRSVQHRRSRNTIHSMVDSDGVLHHSQDAMGKIAVDYYQGILSGQSEDGPFDVTGLYPRKISSASQTTLAQPVTNEEIKIAMYAIPDEKAPGPDGFTAKFFKQTWNTTGGDVTRAVQHFFKTSRLPRGMNATKIAMVGWPDEAVVRSSKAFCFVFVFLTCLSRLSV
ncbi:hypothetical protein SADUNF_Sadunf11G0124500 [Salix dunnii]|uniref:Endonuclease/exonuclease/phosphatase domain-containing protein n=1 Tax=Salix dunnii TaxID=1413687 RepID=A0A835MTT9_9ROSI|nr:hypothetical protein SADUNF_Sadunf11G0124500 [Salix dunnii]